MEARRMDALRWTGAAGPVNDRRMNAPLRDLFSPVRLGPHELPNRIVMAPMTRNRPGAGAVPIVSEGTQVTPQGQGYPGTPGIHSVEQIAGWKRVTDAVHARGGRIFCQLWHVGRISHPLLQPGGAQ